MPTRSTPATVHIFGAGVTGLTAAHELIERGFSVHVYERKDHVGGLAVAEESPAEPWPAPPLGGDAPDQGLASPNDWPHGASGLNLPTEHGFRFFPSFYRHVYDTMRRTPRFVGPKSQRRPDPDGSTVADMLIATTRQGVAMEDGMGIHVIPRAMVDSAQAISQEIFSTMSQTGMTSGDILRFQFKVFQFLTSCPARRRVELEQQSWWQFLEGERFSKKFGEAINQMPRLLVAMDAKRSDARTQGAVLAQLYQDQFSDGAQTDRTLAGPTGKVWLDPWVEYLKNQGVKFHFKHELIKLLLGPEGDELVVVGAALHDLSDPANPRVVNPEASLDPYFVLALPVHRAVPLAKSTMEEAASIFHAPVPPESSLARLAALDTTNCLARMSGVQLYFRQDLPIVRGHVVYPQSEWALSSISQAQFWREDLYKLHGIRGIMSIDVSAWDVDSGVLIDGRKRKALECTGAQVAVEVWRQIKEGLQGAVQSGPGLVSGLRDPEDREFSPIQVLPDPVAWAVDDPPEAPWDPNAEKEMMINLPGAWKDRPGSSRDGYPVILGRLVLAGPYNKTTTRLTTMEAANESARHAVNSILRREEGDGNWHGQGATIWPMEAWEPKGLDDDQLFDARLCKEGLPHAFDILRVMDALDVLLPAENAAADPRTPLQVLEETTGLSRAQLALFLHVSVADLEAADQQLRAAFVPEDPLRDDGGEVTEPEAVLLPSSGGTTHRIRTVPLTPGSPGGLPRPSRHVGRRTTPDVGTHLVGLYSKLRGF